MENLLLRCWTSLQLVSAGQDAILPYKKRFYFMVVRAPRELSSESVSTTFPGCGRKLESIRYGIISICFV
jgi:hypothetical protein